MIGLAFASGYLTARSITLSPAGLMTSAQVQIWGAVAAVVLIFVAFSLHRKVVRVSKKHY